MGESCNLYAKIHSRQPSVTGSGFYIEFFYPDRTRETIVLDYGLYQGSDEEIAKNAKIDFKDFNPSELSAILVTHAHIDHIGRIPMLYKNGAKCRTFMTEDTLRVAEKLLENTANILVNDSQSNGVPIYSVVDCEKAMLEFRACDCNNDWISITSHIQAMFIRNQHMPGAAMVFIKVSYPGERSITMLFSGDINDYNMFSEYKTRVPYEILGNELSVLICESTYGDRKRRSEETGKFKNDVVKYAESGKNIICTAFAFGRFQALLLSMKQLQDDGLLSVDIPIYIDGKLGCDITAIWSSLETVEVTDFMPKNVIRVSDRKALMSSDGQKIIITTSGMGTFGPAREYIPYYIDDENAVIYIAGYASVGSNSRNILDAEYGDVVCVSGIMKEKKAIVESTGEFSSHSRKNELVDYISSFAKVDLLLLNHGEAAAKLALADSCKRKCKNIKKIDIVDGITTYKIGAYGFVKSY